MLRCAVPVCAAAVVLSTGCGSTQHVSVRARQQLQLSFTVGRGTIVPATARGISVVVNGSSGTFRTLRPGTRPRVVLADDSSDLDGDGLPDLVTDYNGQEEAGDCSEDSGVTVCTSWAYVTRSLAPGRFRRSRVVYSSEEDEIQPLAAGDVTGDGRPDLVLPFSNFDEDGVEVLVNHGSGRFVPRRTSLLLGQAPVAAALVDLDGDGTLDLATANDEDETNRLADGSVSVFLGTKGGLGRRRDYLIGGGADSLVVRDLNGDGMPDIAVSRGEAGPFVSVLLNRGDGTFGPKADYRGAGHFAAAVAAADVDGDGRPDLVVANGDREGVGHGISVLMNRGRGTFKPPFGLLPRERVLAIASGDLNGDGREDLLVQTLYGSAHATVLVLLNRG
jgi:hypothetical protein